MTPDLAIFIQENVWLFQKLPKIQTPFQNQLCTILEGDTPRRRAWETIGKIGSQETFTKLGTPGAVPRSSELLGRGMMVRDGEC